MDDVNNVLADFAYFVKSWHFDIVICISRCQLKSTYLKEVALFSSSLSRCFDGGNANQPHGYTEQTQQHNFFIHAMPE